MPLVMETVAIDDLNPYYKNPRQGDVGAISESLRVLGQYRTIVMNLGTLTGRPNEILAGNHTYLGAKALGWDSLDVNVQDVDDETAARIVAVDNRTADLATYDTAELVDLLEMLANTDQGLVATGYDGDDLDDLMADLAGFDLPDEKYTRKVIAPVYEPTGPRPDLEDLFDATRTHELNVKIDAAEIPTELRKFLRAAAERHTVFRFDRIANYYAHADAEVQDLMEESALVIIDFDRAIELGYVALNEEVASLFQEEYPDA